MSDAGPSWIAKIKKTSTDAVWIAFGNPLYQEGTSYLVFGSRYSLIPEVGGRACKLQIDFRLVP